jgi:hypothetical protein
MSDPRRQPCPLCGESRKLSDQHAWPDWLIKALPYKGTPMEERRRDYGEPLDILETNLAKARKVAARLCKTCNSEWMNRIEQPVQPLIKAMLTGDSLTLRQSDQAAIATWAVMTTMVHQLTKPNPPSRFTERAPRWLREYETVPQGYAAFIARCSPEFSPLYWTWKSAPRKQRPPKGSWDFVQIHDFIFQVTYIHDQGDNLLAPMFVESFVDLHPFKQALLWPDETPTLPVPQLKNLLDERPL